MATAAEPILASTLWNARGTAYHSNDEVQPAKRLKLATGLRSLDVALDGGLDYGKMCCISSDPDGRGRDFSVSLLASHLLDTFNATATIIDTTLSFDVKRLHRQLMTSLRDREADNVSQRAIEALDRLRIMKVFDFIGMTESVAEFRDSLEHSNMPSVGGAPPKGTIGDSEDEDEMLDTPLLPAGLALAETNNLPSRTTHSQGESCSLLVIDDITQVASPLLKNNYAEGQALLTSFMRSLSQLTKTNNLCVVLLNRASTHVQASDEAPSIFSSCILRPALGKSFSYLMDVHLLVHTMPKTSEDAKAMFRSTQVGRKGAVAETVNVLEVLQDRYGGRVGRWAPFDTDEEGRLKDVTFR